MKTRTYKGKTVVLLHKTSHGVSLVCDTFAYPNGKLGQVAGTQQFVPTGNLDTATVHRPVTKQALTPDDESRLNAARGLVFGKPRVRGGLKPTVLLYNLAIKCGEYMGALIAPIGI